MFFSSNLLLSGVHIRVWLVLWLGLGLAAFRLAVFLALWLRQSLLLLPSFPASLLFLSTALIAVKKAHHHTIMLQTVHTHTHTYINSVLSPTSIVYRNEPDLSALSGFLDLLLSIFFFFFLVFSSSLSFSSSSDSDSSSLSSLSEPEPLSSLPLSSPLLELVSAGRAEEQMELNGCWE